MFNNIMAYTHKCDHTKCCTANPSVVQTLTEMDWEKGLWNAAFSGDIERVQSIIDKAKDVRQVVNCPDNAGYSPLHYAARNNHINICKLLLQQGAFINAVTNGKATPLHKAAAAGKTAAVQFLLKSGALLDCQDADGETILHKAISSRDKDLVNYLQNQYPHLANVKDNKGRTAAEILKP